MSNAGLHLDREDELLLETFGPAGPLRPWAQVDLLNHAPEGEQPDWRPGPPRGELALVTRTLEAWHRERTTGEHLDTDELARAAKWTHDWAANKLRKKHPSNAFAEAITEGAAA